MSHLFPYLWTPKFSYINLELNSTLPLWNSFNLKVDIYMDQMICLLERRTSFSSYIGNI